MISYEEANKLLEQYIQNVNLRKHCYAVEACMRFYAKQLNEDEEKWAIAGLLHDLDWETNPDTHPITAIPVLEAAGVDKEVTDAILGHAYPIRSDVKRETLMAKYLFACDEFSGFIVAYSLMKPGKLNEVDPAGVMKKLKNLSFAKGVSREDIQTGLDETGLSGEAHAKNLIEAMKADNRLGLS